MKSSVLYDPETKGKNIVEKEYTSVERKAHMPHL